MSKRRRLRKARWERRKARWYCFWHGHDWRRVGSYETEWVPALIPLNADWNAPQRWYRTCKRCERMELVTVDSFATEAADE